MRSLGSEADFEVKWKPFFLNPNTPMEGIPLIEYISSRYGEEAGRKIAEGKSPLVQVGKELGISFTKDRSIVNTMKSHCMIEYAGSLGREDAVVEALFETYFEKGNDINSDSVLFKVAEDTGLDKDALKQQLDDKSLKDTILAGVSQARRKSIHGVPFFEVYMNGVNNTRPASFSGAQESEMFIDLFKKLLAHSKSKV